MGIGERIKQIRKNQNQTMEVFGQRIGVTRNSISMIESGRNNPSDQTIRSICREFSVSETWLRTGEGDMYEPRPTDLLEALTVEYGFSEKERRVAEMFLTLDVNRRRAALEYLSDVVDALNGEDAIPTMAIVEQEQPEEPAEEKLDLSEEEIEARVANYRDLLKREQRMRRQYATERLLLGNDSETWTDPNVTGGKASSGSAG